MHKSIGDSYHLLGVCYKNEHLYDSSLFCIKKAIDIRTKVLGPTHKDVGKSYNNLGNLYVDMNEPELAIEAYKVCVGIYLNSGDDSSEALAAMYNNIGIRYMDAKYYKIAYNYLEKALAIVNLPAKKNSNAKSIVYGSMASYYSETGDYQKAIFYYQEALTMNTDIYGENNEVIGNIYTSLGNCYYLYGMPEKSKKAYHKALEILISVAGENQETVANIYAALGGFYDIEKYEYYNKKAEKILLNLPNANQGIVAQFYYNYSAGYLNAGKYEEAEKYLLKALNIYDNLPDADIRNYGMAITHASLGQCYSRLKQYSLSERYFNKYLTFVESNSNNNNLYSTHSENLGHLAKMYLNWYKDSLDIKNLLKSKKYSGLFDRNLQRIWEEISYSGSKSLHLFEARRGYETGMEAAKLLYNRTDSLHYLHTAFTYAEKTKSLLLYEGTQETNALHFSGISDSLLDREYNLRVDIAYCDRKSFELESKGAAPTDSILLALHSRAFDLRQQYEALKKTFETDYPDYYRLKYDLRVEDVAAVQRDLLYPDMALVEYFVGDSAVYIFTIRKQDYSVLEVKKDFPLEQWVAQLRQGMTAFQIDLEMAGKYDSLSILYTEAASNIYTKLVAPIAAKLPAKVIVIPDGVLGYVPFEALLVEKPENPTRWSQHHYLLNDHSVSYGYSATMLREMLYRKHKHQPATTFLGFAPIYDGDTTLLDSLFQYDDDRRNDLKPLPYSGEEVYRVANMMKGQAIIGKEASKAAFTEKAGQARILHLATHGQANDRAGDYCFLVFANQKDSAKYELLYARDIYNLQLNADLVTLSACETGIGELQGGEGIISLARAFAYAGAKSIVTSLWSVSDLKTKDLMIDFYKNLRKGMLKDDALRQAKLDFLKRNRGQAAHPFYWAGFVGIGNMGKVK
ncbi:MAG TPA: CHAT domain-containing protein [Saprospiraceae bacterium]|nr:CHAT domain-containing protein [Saprospiraceae bacterium]